MISGNLSLPSNGPFLLKVALLLHLNYQVFSSMDFQDGNRLGLLFFLRKKWKRWWKLNYGLFEKWLDIFLIVRYVWVMLLVESLSGRPYGMFFCETENTWEHFSYTYNFICSHSSVWWVLSGNILFVLFNFQVLHWLMKPKVTMKMTSLHQSLWQECSWRILNENLQERYMLPLHLDTLNSSVVCESKYGFEIVYFGTLNSYLRHRFEIVHLETLTPWIHIC